jgi:histidinol-phosphate aminotransferase
MNRNLDKISPYVISDREYSSDMIYLDWNEGYELDDSIKNQIQKNIFDLKWNQYPDLTSKDLLDSLSKYTNTDKEFIQVYNGSDSALDHTFRILLNDGDKVIIPSPNYNQINQTITSLGGIIECCDINGLEETIKRTENPKIVYISNPNNPMGYVYDIKPLVLKYPEIFFIVDEAYYEFSKQYSMFDSAYKYPNVVVTRTFSKALGLASVRLGYLTSNSYIISKLRKIKNFKEVNQLAQIAGKVVLDNIDVIENNIKQMKIIKQKFLRTIKGVRVYDSHSNFVLIEHPLISDIILDLKKNNILVRDRSNYINNTMRVTIGQLENMKIIANIINKYSL